MLLLSQVAVYQIIAFNQRKIYFSLTNFRLTNCCLGTHIFRTMNISLRQRISTMKTNLTHDS